MTWADELYKMKPEERTNLQWDDPRLTAMAEAIEKQYDLPIGIIRAIKFAENTGIVNGKISPSKNTSKAKSPKGAQGIMQFMPGTMKLQGGKFQHNPLDPVESIEAAGRYLQHTLKYQYKGNVLAAIADYNGGPNQAKRVLQGKKPAAQETKDYLEKTMRWFEQFEEPQQ
jgi:hypothetical protein